jgi:hypothetical protein
LEVKKVVVAVVVITRFQKKPTTRPIHTFHAKY